MRYVNLLFVLMAALSTTSGTYGQQPVNSKDSLALVDFYNACNGPNWLHLHWFLEEPVANWSGVTVVGDRVTELWLHENGVVGTIPESFGNLTSLESLNFSYNGVALPEFIGNFTNLHTIDVRGNFMPSIPASIGNLINLKELHLGENRLLNSLPESIGKLTNLTILGLDDCQLTDLPESLTNLTSLEKLRLEYNNLTFADLEPIVTAFPSTVSVVYSPQLTFKLEQDGDKLVASVGGTPQNNTFYWYRDDMLIATITGDSTYPLSQPGKYRVEVINTVVTQLRLKSSVIAHPPSNLTLTCPPDTTLEAGEAESTALVNGIDPMITGAAISDVIYTLSGAGTGGGPGTASGQPFYRGVTTVIYTLSSDASKTCSFTVTVKDFNAPPGVNVQDSLALVDLYDSTNGANWNNNHGWKQGPVSTWYGVDVLDGRVTQLDLSQNNLLGSVPESFGNLTKMNTLFLPYNQLSALPESFGNLAALKYSMLASNQLTSVPASIGNLANLQALILTNNQLSSLPVSVGKLTNLSFLILGFNKLTAIPESIGNLTNLQEVDLSNNQLTSLPESFGKLTKLENLRLEANQLSSLPESFGDLTGLNWLQLEKNKLTFAELEWIVNILASTDSISYSPQDSFALAQQNNTLIASVGGTPQNNTYYWYRDDIQEATIKGDSTYMPTESGNYRLVAINTVVTGLALLSEVVQYVPDDNAHPVVNIKDVTVYESDGKAKVMVHIEHPTTVPLRLSFKTVAGSATAHGPLKDYISRAGYVKIHAGMTSGKIRIPIRKDTRKESAETFYVVIRKKGFREDISVVGRDTALVTILDGDREPEMTSIPTEQIGKKAPASIATEATALSISASPNPSKGAFRITIGGDSRQVVDLCVTNALGMKIDTKRGLRGGQIIEMGRSYVPGTYFLTAQTGAKSTTITLIRQ